MPMSKTSKGAAWLAALAIAGGGGWWGYQKWQATKGDATTAAADGKDVAKADAKAKGKGKGRPVAPVAVAPARSGALNIYLNGLGTVTPLKEIIRLAHARGIPVMVDGSQGAVHLPVDVRELDADFYVFTGHKVYGPTGIGVLYGKREWLEKMPPFNSRWT